MTRVLNLQLKSDPELGDDAPISTVSFDHCLDGEGA